MKKLLAFALILLLLFSFAPAVSAQEETLSIRTTADWNALAQKCVLDRNSKGLRVSLENDLDFSGEEFSPIPLFAGYFEGNNHSLRGICESGAASAFGVFRRILEGGEVRNLNVFAEISLEESEAVGSIAGSNAGTIRHCSFEGSISALKCAGGICGRNEETGAILRCSASGEVSAQHRAGGVCGENAGKIEHSYNAACVNTKPLGQVLPDELDPTLSAEEVVSLTDLGGICGYSDGALVSCKNTAEVGYLHLGCNVGGVCGRSCGIIRDCKNEGNVLGKKDVGGILGQLDPDREWDFSQGNLNELQEKLDTLKRDIDLLSASASAAQEGLSAQAGALIASLSGAGAAAANFTSDVESWAKENGVSRETLGRLAEKGKEDISSLPENTAELSERIREIPEKAKEIYENNSGLSKTAEEIRENAETPTAHSSFESAAPGELVASLRSAKNSLTALQGQLSDPSLIAKADQVSSDLFEVSDYLNGILRSAGKKSTYQYFKDISLTGTDTIGMISGSENRGDVKAETNVGGVVGAISVDYSLETGDEDEIDLASMVSGGAKYLIFAAIENCRSESQVNALKNTAGGIVGKMDFGAAVDCAFGGEVRSLGSYAGGIAGLSKGSLRSCEARANLSAEKYLGGIAGLGCDLSGCLALPYFETGAQYLGSIAGDATGSVFGNYYSASEFGGIDGFSFEGSSEALGYEALLEKSENAELFRRVRVRFLCEGKTVFEEMIGYGETLDAAPEMPAREGLRFYWDDLPEGAVTRSLSIEGRYEKPIPTLSTSEEPPRLLCEGAFEPGQTLELSEIAAPEAAGKTPIGAFEAKVEGYSDDLTLHLRMTKDAELYKIDADSLAEPLAFEREGSYLVFTIENGGRFACYEAEENPLRWILPAAAAALLLLTLLILVILGIRKKRARIETEPAPEAPKTPEAQDA